MISDSKPWVSQSMGCHPSQTKQMNEDLHKAGITGAYMRKDGTLECSSRKARKEAMRFYSMFDRDAGYGDRADP